MRHSRAKSIRQHIEERLAGIFGERFQAAHGGPLIGSVWPAGEQELRALAAVASEFDLPLVPRGAGSSPYGAATADAGLLVSFERMDRVLDLDAEAGLITVQPGATWNTVLYAAATSGLMPRVMPSSRAFSTVGGFVAQGGVGVGSYQFGPIDDHVAGLRLVALTGRTLDLDPRTTGLAVGAEGRTGLLSQVTLRLQPRSDMSAVVAQFDDPRTLELAVRLVGTRELPLWSISLIDPTIAAGRSRMGGPRRPRLDVDRYGALFSFRSSDGLAPELERLVRVSGGQVSREEASHDQWIDRFMGFQVLRTTPVPLQFHLPLTSFVGLLERLPEGWRGKLGFEGVVTRAGEELVLRFLLLNRPLSMALNWNIASELLPLVKELGGRSYATGAFFLEEAEAIYGAERVRQLREFHRGQDPRDLLNPGKGFADIDARGPGLRRA